eukprot:CAMPEP_0178412088 /NCGR_PEP_ID=MMETSP0689_2-20121128/21831_1 /TAXON_ID=160604 /ORGANISM="Amphidinium massartii, Strain CS-259" /LENGTH=741 /DNA_ID=CAMNT_0020033317 /DNA_START=70 /DNA_END=2295 /DNA_ORIENTATION=+
MEKDSGLVPLDEVRKIIDKHDAQTPMKRCRLKLVRSLFKELDILKRGRLGSGELYAFAVKAINYAKSRSHWEEKDFFDMCIDLKVDHNVGLHEASFAEVLKLYEIKTSVLRTCLQRLSTEDDRKYREADLKASSTEKSRGGRLVSAPPQPPQATEHSPGARLTKTVQSKTADAPAQQNKLEAKTKEESGLSKSAALKPVEVGRGAANAGVPASEEDFSTIADDLTSQADSTAATSMATPRDLRRPEANFPILGGLGPFAGPMAQPPWGPLAPQKSWDSSGWEAKDGKQDSNRSVQCIRALKALVEKVLPDGKEWDVMPFGSMASGFATSKSDLDVVILRRDEDQQADPVARRQIQARVLEKLEAAMTEPKSGWQVKAKIPNARVPILTARLQTKDGSQELDISVNNRSPLLNTKLLKAYADCGPHIPQLVVHVKDWAKHCGVAGASSGNLSPYALTLMVIYFLQVGDMGEERLPVLKQDSPRGKWMPKKGTEMSEVLTAFFTFYGGGMSPENTRPFDWGREVVSIRLGRRENVDHEEFSKLNRRKENRIHIEDPIELHRNLQDVLWIEREQVLYESFKTYGNYGNFWSGPMWQPPLMPPPFGMPPYMVPPEMFNARGPGRPPMPPQPPLMRREADLSSRGRPPPPPLIQKRQEQKEAKLEAQMVAIPPAKAKFAQGQSRQEPHQKTTKWTNQRGGMGSGAYNKDSASTGSGGSGAKADPRSSNQYSHESRMGGTLVTHFQL